jgi:hypothetical protein
LHGVHWSREYEAWTHFGEIDFVVLNRAGKVLFIEQKNGALEEASSGVLTVNGVADYCCITEEGVPSSCPSVGNASAVRGYKQSKRCHAIDGCSVPIGDLDLRNNPMPLAQFNRVPVEFGDGELPPEEFFVHGQDNKPARKLGCNMHDVCYQTCVPINQRQACDEQMYDLNKAKCREAYPSKCPYTITGPLGGTIPNPVTCPLWLNEKNRCFFFA